MRQGDFNEALEKALFKGKTSGQHLSLKRQKQPPEVFCKKSCS